MNLKKARPSLLAGFKKCFGGGAAVRIALAPGRSNLIGEHTDYNGGLVLPVAVDRHTAVVFRPAAQGRLRVYSETVRAGDEFGLEEIAKLDDPKSHWANYVRGTAAALAKRGIKLKGGDLYIASDLPRGAGLSSSAALEVATALALLELAGRKMERQELAFACQEAEHTFAGVRCGIMDQTVVARAQPGHALLLDCLSLEVKQIPISLKDYAFATFDTGVRHKLAGSEYNKRRAECEHAAAVLKKKNLRAVNGEDLLKNGAKLTANEHKRARHVLTEDARVAQFAAALSRGDVAELGWLLHLSHQSLARDYEVSCVELDRLVAELARLNGKNGACPGARMTGGGFGGAVVALLKKPAFPRYTRALKSFAKGGTLLIEPSGGAMVMC
jgi:galactokinase